MPVSTPRTTKYALQRLLWILLLCFSLPMFTSCDNTRIIVHDLSEREANEIIDFLNSKSIVALKVKSTEAGGGGAAKVVLWDISVVEKDAPQALSLLNQYGLPRRTSQNLLNIFSNSGLVPSEMSEKIRYEAGLGDQIASTIRKMDGVIDADVRLSFPVEDPLHPEAVNKQKITASVYVKYSPLLEDPNAHLVSKIKQLVSSSITGLDYDNVTVVLDRSRFGEMQYGVVNASKEEKTYANIWSVIVAEGSVARFRAIFFTFIVTLLVLMLALCWLLWKLYPIIEEIGGFKALFKREHLKISGGEKPKDDDKPTDEENPPPPPTEGGVT